jgi:hypothetical protein
MLDESDVRQTPVIYQHFDNTEVLKHINIK